MNLLRLDVCDAVGKPVYSLPLTASISPRATDENVSSYFHFVEQLSPNHQSFEKLLRGLPGYRIVHLFDKVILQFVTFKFKIHINFVFWLNVYYSKVNQLITREILYCRDSLKQALDITQMGDQSLRKYWNKCNKRLLT